MLAEREKTTEIDVLIADDDPTLRYGVRRLLERQGFRCTEAEEGGQVLEIARKHQPRCVLLDLSMPVLDGFTVMHLLRADPHMSGMHINCLTGLTEQDVQNRAHKAGCEAFLTKPVDPRALLSVVRQQVRQDRQGELAGLTRLQAESVLDWLETWKCRELKCDWQMDGFCVRWVWPNDNAPDQQQLQSFVAQL